MGIDNFIERHFDTAMKIHAYCFDNNISKDDAKLFVYIYVKALESPDGFEYFKNDCTSDIEAITALLGEDSRGTVIFTEPVTPESIKEMYAAYISCCLKKLEYDMQQEYGLENLLRGELLRRLRFHTDLEYQNNCIAVLQNCILPGIEQYSDELVKISNINYQIKLYREEDEFRYMFY